MHVRSFVFLSAFVYAGATPLLARQSWQVPSRHDHVAVLQDEHGRVTTAVRPGVQREIPAQQSDLVANWQALGPFGGDIEDVQASPTNPNIVLAGLAPSGGGAGGIYRSIDAGATWSTVASLTGPSVHDIAFAPDGTAYAGTLDGVWRSTDGGATFVNLPLGIGVNDQVLDVDVDPVNPLRLWIGVADALGSQTQNVLESTNGGATWTNRTPPLPSSLSCSTIAIDPTNTQKIYAGFQGFGGGAAVWVSTNGGVSWTDRSAGLPGTPINDLAHNGTRIYVAGGQLFGSQNFGLYSSANDGATWDPMHDGTWTNLVSHDIAFDPNNASIVLVASAGAGVYRSTNAGSAWTGAIGGTGGLSVNAVSFSPGSSSTIYTASASVAVWKSTNAGTNFNGSSNGIGSLDVYSIASNPLNASELAVAFQGQNNGGVYTSLDAGATWALAALPGTRFQNVRFSAQGVLYAISDGPTTIGAEALYRRTGSSWASIGPNQGPVFESELFGMRISDNDPNLIIAVGNDFGAAGFEPTAWRTTNGGTNWTKTYEGLGVTFKPLQDVVCADPTTDTTWVAPFVDFNGPGAGGVLRSTNSGATWSFANTGLPAEFQGYSIARSQAASGKLYVSNAWSTTAQAVYTSTDAGASWTSTGYVGQAFEVEVDGADADGVYIAQLGAVRVRESTDGGATFSPFNTGLPTNDFPHDLQRATGGGSDLLYAGTAGSYSTDLVPVAVLSCFGDGTGIACPCGPPSAPGTGCRNSFTSGAQLAAAGAPSVAGDTLVLTATNVPPNASTLFFQGTTQTAQVFGDGIRCAGGTVVRLGTETASGGVVAYPGVGDPSVSVRGLIPPTGGVRHYQGWYRNAAAFCTPSTFNLTNGATVTWVP